MKKIFELSPVKLDNSDRNLYICKGIDQASIEELVKNIVKINEEDEHYEQLFLAINQKYQRIPIKIYIDSYGGMVYQTLGLISIMDKSKTPIHTIVTGCAMSAGFMILISGHKRFAYEMSTPLYHQMSGGAIGTVKEMDESMEQKKKIQKQLESIVLKKTKITKKRLKEVYEKKLDWYMTATDAKKLGVVDEII